MRFVHEGMWAVTFGLVEALRPGETTTGMPFARVWANKERRAVSEGRLMVNMLSLQRLREDERKVWTISSIKRGDILGLNECI